MNYRCVNIGRVHLAIGEYAGPMPLGDECGSWLFSLSFDGDDEAGDPSGICICVLGKFFEVYWPMHHRVMVDYALGERLRVSRW